MALGVVVLLSGPARADTVDPTPTTTDAGPAAQADKSGYWLFNPTPTSLLRDFNTSRPSVTESPYTVDAGHLQAELSFVEYTYDIDLGRRTDGFSVFPTELRLGVLNNAELDLLVDPYLDRLTHAAGRFTRSSGFGDMQVRGKLNVWGNEGGPFAGAVAGYVSFPTASGGLGAGQIEGGIVLPVAVQLPADFSLAGMAEFDFVPDAAGRGEAFNVVHTITLGRDLVKGMAGYIEYVGVAPVRSGQTYLASFDTGLTFAVRPNVQLDVGINIGLSNRADDFTVFTGLSFRL